MRVREARADDTAEVLALVRAKAHFDRERGAFSGELGTTEELIHRHLFGPRPFAFALLAVAWGSAHTSVGVLVRRRRHWSRLAALLLGSVDLLLLPYGTALGLYTLFVLLRDDTKRYFEPS